MPFKSEKQKKYLWKNHPEIAKKWTKRYGSKKTGGLSGGVRFGPPPKRGPNPLVPPVKLKRGSK
tara:strand:- start:43 stop:234 length:192 start_codon:yes stop_codon:yes gene_type:complete